MNPPTRPSRIGVEDVGDVSIVTFIDRRVHDEQRSQMIGDDLFRLVDELGRRKMLLNLGNVEAISSVTMNKFVTLLRKVRLVNGRIVMCGVPRNVMEMFQIVRIDRLFTIVTAPTLPTAHDVMYEVFGDPLRPVRFSADWRTDAVLLLATQMREANEFGAMPILADALQDAGCDADDLLHHLRDTARSHVRECWVLDLVLNIS